MELKSKYSEEFKHMMKLYHFTSFDTALRILCSCQLKFGKLSNMNDACENSKIIFNNCGYEQACEDSKIRKELRHYEQISFSEDKADCGRKGFELQQMWGLYADSGYGICLVFDKRLLVSSLDAQCKSGVVSYDWNFSQETNVDIPKNADIKECVKKSYKELFFKKRKEWEHEQEFRIICRFASQKKNHFLNVKSALKFVIFFNARNITYTESDLNSMEYQTIKKLLPPSVVLLHYAIFDKYDLIDDDGCPIYDDTEWMKKIDCK
mgnify:FL=1